MKKIVLFLFLSFLVVIPATETQAFFGGGGLKGPLPVYNKNSSVDAATLAMRITTAKQLEADLANLQKMDPATAAANAHLIYDRLQRLFALQQENQNMIADYENFQTVWDEQYGSDLDYQQMNAAEYAKQARILRESMDKSLRDAMQMQGYVVHNSNSADALQQLLASSQSAEGALAAAQVGNQIAAIQAQQMMQFQVMAAQSNQMQAQWMRDQLEKEKMEQERTERYFSEPPAPVPGQGPGFVKFKK